ncbi:hypothetical protein J6590_091578 [Homalodisca vitripennis]|nr:hypothetical protein J6590_091578 [Homalodisca vitripennis]
MVKPCHFACDFKVNGSQVQYEAFTRFLEVCVVLVTPPLEKAQEALTALTVFLPFPGPPSASTPVPAPRHWRHWRCAGGSSSYRRTLLGDTSNSPFQGTKISNVEFGDCGMLTCRSTGSD